MVNIKKAEKIYRESVSILKQLQLANGGFLASFPDKRYPYVYIRDHAICILAFMSAGLLEGSKAALEFAFKHQKEDGSFPQRLDSKGKDASYKPLQIDGNGLILFSAARFYKSTRDKKFVLKYWKNISKAIEFIVKNIDTEKNLVYTINSIHEYPTIENGLEIWSNAVCCAAMMELTSVAKSVGKGSVRLDKISSKIKSGILKYMWDSQEKIFIKTIRVKETSSIVGEIDASNYALADFNVVKDTNSKIKSTVKAIEEQLWDKKLGGICRYLKYIGRNNGGHGPWPHFTLMLCRHFIKTKNKKKADKYLSWVMKISYKSQLPEHLASKKEFEEYVKDFRDAGLLREDRLVMIKNVRKHEMFKRGLAYSVIPLAWPHAEFIRTWNLYKKTFFKA